MSVLLAHWDEFGMVAFIAFAGIVLVVRGIRGLIEQKRGGTRVP
jgi:hypothetical protein